jgi:hypothetical protein
MARVTPLPSIIDEHGMSDFFIPVSFNIIESINVFYSRKFELKKQSRVLS